MDNVQESREASVTYFVEVSQPMIKFSQQQGCPRPNYSSGGDLTSPNYETKQYQHESVWSILKVHFEEKKKCQKLNATIMYICLFV